MSEIFNTRNIQYAFYLIPPILYKYHDLDSHQEELAASNFFFWQLLSKICGSYWFKQLYYKIVLILRICFCGLFCPSFCMYLWILALYLKKIFIYKKKWICFHFILRYMLQLQYVQESCQFFGISTHYI